MVLSKFKAFGRFFMILHLFLFFSVGVTTFTKFGVSPVQAQQLRVQSSSGVNSLGPFARIGRLLVGLFLNVRNFLYIAAAFTLVWMFYGWIKEGKVDWEKIVYIGVALALMASVGYFVESVSGGAAGSNDNFIPQSTIQIN